MITLAAKQETGNDDIRPIINRTRKSYQNMVSRQLERSPLEERKVSRLVSDLHIRYIITLLMKQRSINFDCGMKVPVENHSPFLMSI